MTWDFLGGEIGSLLPIDSQVFENTGAGLYDSTFSRAGTRCYSGSSYAESPTLTSRTEAWFHGEVTFDTVSGSVTGVIFYWLNSTGNPMIRLLYTNTGSLLQLAYWDGATWTNAGLSATGISIDLNNAVHTIDIYAKVNSAAGELALYVAGAPRITGTGLDMTGIANLNKFRLYGTTTSTTRDTIWSQLGVRTTPTVGCRIITVPMTGNGFSTAWTGAFGDIDEAVYSDADIISGAANTDKELYTGTPVLSDLTGYVITAVAVTSRAKKSGSGPAQFRHLLRSAGTTYNGSTYALAVSYAPFVTIWETNPATSVAFLSSEIAALQYGVEAIT